MFTPRIPPVGQKKGIVCIALIEILDLSEEVFYEQQKNFTRIQENSGWSPVGGIKF